MLSFILRFDGQRVSYHGVRLASMAPATMVAPLAVGRDATVIRRLLPVAPDLGPACDRGSLVVAAIPCGRSLNLVAWCRGCGAWPAVGVH